MTDYNCILNGKWITDSIINAGQKLIKEAFPHIGGLQVTTLGEILAFQMERREFVQVLHVNNNHWITVSNIQCTSGNVNIFDCNLGMDISHRTKQLICSLVRSQDKKITLRIKPVQRQNGSSDCAHGVFALAFATSLCSKVCPTTFTYHQSLMRKHLLECLTNGTMTVFPGNVIRQPRRSPSRNIEVDIFCRCRLPLPEFGRMAQCDGCQEWFHEECETIPASVWKQKRRKWLCSICAGIEFCYLL